jgi:hypothetical protein
MQSLHYNKYKMIAAAISCQLFFAKHKLAADYSVSVSDAFLAAMLHCL